LFQPFDIGKWFTIGFCAFLAFFGSGGGGNFNFQGPGGGGGGGGGGAPFDPGEFFEQIKEFVLENLHWIIPAAITVVLLIILFGILILWLSSRGRFMFLHCVVNDRAEIAVPWTRYREHGNSLFLFRLVLGLISFFVSLLVVGGIIFVIVVTGAADAGVVPLVIIGIIGFFIILVMCLVIGLIEKFTNDFVVPIMFLRSCGVRAGWGQFRELLRGNGGNFIVYILFQILIAIAIGVIGGAVACMFMCVIVPLTCGLACCLMAIPFLSQYLNCVLLLPLLVFKRSYSLYYLRQFGPDYDVFYWETAQAGVPEGHIGVEPEDDVGGEPESDAGDEPERDGWIEP
jgi:hypothetical protein